MNGLSNGEQFASVNSHNSTSFPVTFLPQISILILALLVFFLSQLKTSATLKKLITIAYWRKCKLLALIASKTNFIILRSSNMKPDQSFDIKSDDEWGLNFPSILTPCFIYTTQRNQNLFLLLSLDLVLNTSIYLLYRKGIVICVSCGLLPPFYLLSSSL